MNNDQSSNKRAPIFVGESLTPRNGVLYVTLALGKVHTGDCIKLMQRISSATVDLAFADPPFNIGYDYDTYDDRQAYDAYLNWSRDWMSEIYRILKPTGSFWLAIGDDYAAELKVLAQRDLGFVSRSWVIWYYTFGVNCTRKFSRSHTHIFHFVRDPKNFTFNSDDPAVRVPSARQLVYADSRANSKGRLPDDTWILRPQDAPDSFNPKDDTWYFARIAGTFKEREGFHGCQMPEQLLGRIVRISSNPGDLVCDPFTGSGTTLTVAKKLGRKWLGFELSRDYANKANTRIRKANVGESLDGPADPLVSAPSTQKPSRRRKPKNKNGTSTATTKRKTKNIFADDVQALIQAYLQARDGHSTDRVLSDPELNGTFLDACRRNGVSGTPMDWNRLMLKLRKSKRLPRLETKRRTILRRSQLDLFRFGSEIALRIISSRDRVTLDDILCSPDLAAEFDELAQMYAPGFTPFNYRWAALSIRKEVSRWKDKQLRTSHKFSRARQFSNNDFAFIGEVPGLYILESSNEDVYIGETENLRRRLITQREILASSEWSKWHVSSFRILVEEKANPFGLRYWKLPKRRRTRLNCYPSSLEFTAA